MITSPYLYYHNGEFLEISSVSWGHTLNCHAKDIVLGSKLTVHLDEVRPGLGELDYAAFLTELAKLGTEVPLIIEHLESEEEYYEATVYIRKVAADCRVKII